MPSTFPAVLRKLRHLSVPLVAGYFLLVLGGILLDQTTKLHSEKNFLEWSHPNEVHRIEANKRHVFTLGNSPSFVTKSVDKTVKTTSNWLDFHLTYVRNTGAAWGAMSSMPKQVRTPFFGFVTIVALSVVAWLFYSSHPGQRVYRAGLCFILAGALGNFADRVFLGYVIDWIQFHWKVVGWEYSFPVFNAADIFINIGVVLILLDLIANEIAIRKQPPFEEPKDQDLMNAA